jgi:hypothetical protein
MIGSHFKRIKMELKSSVSQGIRQERHLMEKVRCGCSYWRKLGLRFAVVTRPVRWAQLLRL